VAQVGIRIESSGSTIGGAGAGQGNVVASSYTELNGANTQPPVTTYGLLGAGDIYDTGSGNVIQGNTLGISGQSPLIDPPPTGWKVSGEPVQAAVVTAGADTIGGSAPGDGNVVAGGGRAGAGSVVQGNTFTDGGLDHAGGLDVFGFAAGKSVTVGGATATPGTGVGNTFEAVDPSEVELGADDGAEIQGNVFRNDTWGAISSDGQNVTIGGKSANLGNLIENSGYNDTSIVDNGNLIEVPPGLHSAGIRVIPGSNALIEHNTFKDNLGGGAVGIVGGAGTTVTDNTMTGNTFGISFDGNFFPDGDPLPETVNDDQPYPVLRSADSNGSGTVVSGVYDEPASFSLVRSITVDLYAMKTCGNGGTSQQGEVFLGSRTLSVSLAEADFTLTFDQMPAGSDGVTATATAPDGSTSEFSPCFTIGGRPPSYANAGVGPLSGTVAISPAGPSGAAKDVAVAAAKAGKGHGTLLLACPVSAIKYCRGTFKLKLSGRTIARGGFKMPAGYVHPVTITVSGNLFVQLERRHQLTAKLTTTARDGARHHNAKVRRLSIRLTYVA
jgi:hypothetical protein